MIKRRKKRNQNETGEIIHNLVQSKNGQQHALQNAVKNWEIPMSGCSMAQLLKCTKNKAQMISMR